MFRDYGDGERSDGPPAQPQGRRSWMPLYLAAFLLAVVVIELVGHHLLS